MVYSTPLIGPPTVSVIMPAYNAELYIHDAIESILRQSFCDLELIIINDCSTDNTWKIIQNYIKKDSRVIGMSNQKNLKLSRTLNKGIEQSKGKFIARMDADDYALPDRIKKQVEFLEKNPEVGILGGTMKIVSADNKQIGMRKYPLDDQEIRKNIFWFSPFSHPLIMIRKSVLDKVGYYDDYYNPAEDYELYFRIGKVSKFANLPDVLLQYRVIPKSMTTGSTKKMEQKTIEIREKFSNDLDYSMSLPQRIYNLGHKLSMTFIPSKIKMKVFQVIRNSIR